MVSPSWNHLKPEKRGGALGEAELVAEEERRHLKTRSRDE
jgi:hypothetical protein